MTLQDTSAIGHGPQQTIEEESDQYIFCNRTESTSKNRNKIVYHKPILYLFNIFSDKIDL